MNLFEEKITYKDRKYIENSKNEALEYEWFYHCTKPDSLVSMIKSKEMWLSSLQKVNDMEELKRVDVPQYEHSIFVGCFTYDSRVDTSHWSEYADLKDGVLFGLKRDWFNKNVTFLTEKNEKINEEPFHIFNSLNESLTFQQNKIKENVIIFNPYYIADFNFYKVRYNNKQKSKIMGICNWGDIKGEEINLSAPGIIKDTSGECKGKDGKVYKKVWAIEKEIRLKVCITTIDKNRNENPPYFNRIAVSFNENAFKEIPIWFSPEMSEEAKRKNINKIHLALKEANIDNYRIIVNT